MGAFLLPAIQQDQLKAHTVSAVSVQQRARDHRRGIQQVLTAAGPHHHRQQATAHLGIAAGQLHLAFKAQIGQPFVGLLQPALADAAELREQLRLAGLLLTIGKQADGTAVRRAPDGR